MGRILTYAETRGDELRDVALEAATAAGELAGALDAGGVEALVVGPPGIGETAAPALGGYGVDRVHAAEDEAFSVYAPDATLRALEAVLEEGDWEAVVFAASARGKDLAPRAAARLGRPLATEVTDLSVEDGRIVAVRPQYAGKALARVAFESSPALVSVRPNVYLPEPSEGAGELVTLDVPPEPARHRFGPVESGEKEKLDVSEASVVVSGGRGMQGPENWHLLEELADALGEDVALGASRAVVDAGWRPHEEQVGQTGKVVTPELYVAVGISGAIQHLAGMRTSKVIVAVNKDPEAPIFEVADYGIAGDLFEVVPRLTQEIRELRAS